MLYKLIPAVVLVIAIALFFSHPTPFREPEYLAKRERILREAKEHKNDQWLLADYNNDGEVDSAYVISVKSGPDSGIVFVRFNHLIPSIQLSAEFHNISHIEKVNDIDGNGAPEIYFVAIKKGGCDASGFLYRLQNRNWKELAAVDQEGCRKFDSYEQFVDVFPSGRFRISYRDKKSNYEQYYEGRTH